MRTLPQGLSALKLSFFIKLLRFSEWKKSSKTDDASMTDETYSAEMPVSRHLSNVPTLVVLRQYF
jgi:hypothetical protein